MRRRRVAVGAKPFEPVGLGHGREQRHRAPTIRHLDRLPGLDPTKDLACSLTQFAYPNAHHELLVAQDVPADKRREWDPFRALRCCRSNSISPGSIWWQTVVMTANEALLARIVVDPAICFGKPTVKGHRIWVSLILDLLAAGSSVGEVIAEYPQLTEDDVRACIAYGARLADVQFVDLDNVA